MSKPRLEHVNVTVTDPERAARLLETLFDWHVRWAGPARDGGRTIHVGSADDYIALHTGRGATTAPRPSPRASRSIMSGSKSTISPPSRPRSWLRA